VSLLKKSKADFSVWEPLENALRNTVGVEKCRYFMYLGRVALGEVWIFFYKHIYTRRYLNLDGRGNAYKMDSNGHYYPVKLQDAIEYVFSK
jgi:hypothetical protein